MRQRPLSSGFLLIMGGQLDPSRGGALTCAQAQAGSGRNEAANWYTGLLTELPDASPGLLTKADWNY